MLEQAVSSALYRLTLLEKALHSPEPWYLSVGAERREATKQFFDDGVMFLAMFPPHVGEDVPLLSLWHGNDLVGTRPFRSSGDLPHSVGWYLRLGEAVAA